MRKTTRLAGTMAMAAGLMVAGAAGVTHDPPDPGATSCFYSWTDCTGLFHAVLKACPPPNDRCCSVTRMSTGPDGQPDGGDDCILSVTPFCGNTVTPECAEVTWIVPA